MPKAIEVTGLTKSFGKITALDNVDLTIHLGEMVALIGASGSGKSTLLRHLAGLEVGDPTDGSVEILGVTLQKRGRLARDARNQRGRIGFIFQQFNLVGRLTVLINVLTGRLTKIPMYRSLFRLFTIGERKRALEALDRVGIAQWANCRASNLSGGQQQRAAIARTIVQQAKVVLADEPIASLDPESSRRVMEILANLNSQDGTTVVVSLHQVDFALHFCPRVVALARGKVLYDGPSHGVSNALLQKVYSGDPELKTLNLTGTKGLAVLPKEAA